MALTNGTFEATVSSTHAIVVFLSTVSTVPSDGTDMVYRRLQCHQQGRIQRGATPPPPGSQALGTEDLKEISR